MNKMPSNITKAFKNKSALRKMADGGRPTDRMGPLGIERQYMDRANENIRALQTPEGLAAFNERQGALNSGIEASVGEGGVPLLTGSPDLKTDPTAPALTPSLTPMPAGAMIAQGQAAQNNVMLDGMRMGLRTGDRDSFGYYNQRLQDNLSSPSALGGVLPGSSPGQTTTSPVAAAPPSAAPAPAAISLQEMANAYNEAPDASLGLPPPDETPISPVPQSAASITPTSQNSMGTLPPTANAPRNFGELGKRLNQGLRGTSSRLSNYLFNPETRTSRPPLEAPFAEYRRNLRDGGKIRGSGGPTDDKVGPVMLSDGEYVLPTDTAQAIGYENLDAIKDATHTPTKDEKKDLRKMAGGGAYYVDPRERGFTAGYNPRQGQSAVPARGLRGAGGLGLGVGAAVEGMRGYNDYQTLRDAGEEGNIAPQIAAEGLSRVAGAGVGAKAGAMVPIPHPVGRAAVAGAGGLAGFAAPNLIAGMVGHETASSRVNKIRNQNAEDMRASGTLEDGTPAENAPDAGQGFAPSQMTYRDGTPYLADPGRANLRSENTSIPSSAYDINQRFDDLAEELRGVHGSSVTTPFGRRRLDRSRELLDLEKARAQALSGDQTAMINQRGQDISSRDAAAGRAARAASGSAEMNASMLREMRQAENDQRERMEKSQETLWAEAERMTSDNDDFSSRELYDFMLQSEGFMDDFASASPQQRRQMIAQMKDAVAEDRAQRTRARRLGVAHDPGLIEPKGLQRGVRWGDVTNDRATFLRDFVGGNLRGRQYVDYDNMLVPLDDIARQNPDMRGLTNAQILRRLGADQ